MKRILIPALTAVAALALVPASATSAVAAERDFGHHVVQCTQAVGFDGAHNPGMHQGLHAYPGDHVCVMA
ncbi:hypothetical protein ABT304_17555 [Nocardioides sp. NPDC000445]|uniref:hypothetical protein n=1 Tax=Nocardioides sp. NPDC000445 TaxID=3154257 RepID=UPI0033305029